MADIVSIHGEHKIMYVVVELRATFDAIQIEETEYDQREEKKGHVLVKRLDNPQMSVVFQHWLEDSQEFTSRWGA